ncbi:FAD-dependent oxidoreductase [Streptomyces sp. NPDC002740]
MGACGPREWLDDPDEGNPRPTPARFETQVTRAARRFPLLGVPHRPTGIAGVHDAADDWSPICDRTDPAGSYVAIGTSCNRFKNAPLAGRFLATVVDRVEADQDHDRDPLRYTGEHTGVVVDLGAFSGRRPLAEGAASRTVMGSGPAIGTRSQSRCRPAVDVRDDTGLIDPEAVYQRPRAGAEPSLELSTDRKAGSLATADSGTGVTCTVSRTTSCTTSL